MPTLCPHCGKVNTLADAEGYTEEAPREYHAACLSARNAGLPDAVPAATIEAPLSSPQADRPAIDPGLTPWRIGPNGELLTAEEI